MKKQSIYSFMAAAVAAVFVACQPEVPVKPEVSLVNLGEEEITVDAKGEECLLSFKASDAWTATSSEEWVFIGQESGEAGFNDVDLYIEANESGDDRSAIITVSIDAEHCFSVLVSQKQNNVFSVETTSLNIGAEGGPLTFTVSGNIDYEVVSTVDWITVVSTKAVVDNTVTLEIAENEGSERSSFVRIKSSEGDASIKVAQEAGVTDFLFGIEALYYGDYYNSGTANWYLYVYNMDLMEDGEAAKIYYLDLCLPAEYDFLNVEAEGFPEGVFSFKDGFGAFSITQYTRIADFALGEYVYIVDGEIAIKDGVFSFVLTDENGSVHKVKWEIDPELFIPYDSSYSSTVVTDHEVTFDVCTIAPPVQLALDYGAETYQTCITFEGGNPQLGVNEPAYDTAGYIMLSSATEEFTGSYVVEPASEQAFTAGTVDAYNSYFYSYDADLYYVSDGVFQIAGGKLTVTKDGDNYIIEGEFTDDYPYGEPHKLVIHAVGQIESEENEVSAASCNKSLSRKSAFEGLTLERSQLKARKVNNFAITF
ncbi:MAG: BACON domain-containing protein [Candidatus Cryptobacteroides sp.]